MIGTWWPPLLPGLNAMSGEGFSAAARACEAAAWRLLPGVRPGGRVTFFCWPRRKSPKKRASIRSGQTSLGKEPTTGCQSFGSTRSPARWRARFASPRSLPFAQCHVAALVAACVRGAVNKRSVVRRLRSTCGMRAQRAAPSTRERQRTWVRRRRAHHRAGKRFESNDWQPVVSSLRRGVWPNRIEALFFGDFLLSQQKKVTRPPGRTPGNSARRQPTPPAQR